MKGIPFIVLVVAILFIGVGLAGFILHYHDFFQANTNFYEVLGEQFLRVLAIVCGVFLLLAADWARWLSVAWVLAHVIISAFNSMDETVAHLVFLFAVAIVLYLPASSSFFQHKAKGNAYRSQA